MSNTFALRFLCTAALFSLTPPALAAGYFGFFGNFLQDDNKAVFTFTLVAPGSVNIQSWSYGGGSDPFLSVIPSGGFAPVLSLFDSSENLLGFDRGGIVGGLPPDECGTGGRAIDGLSGQCLDAYLQVPLGFAGLYTVVLTQQDNTPNGPRLARGISSTLSSPT